MGTALARARSINRVQPSDISIAPNAPHISEARAHAPFRTRLWRNRVIVVCLSFIIHNHGNADSRQGRKERSPLKRIRVFALRPSLGSLFANRYQCPSIEVRNLGNRSLRAIEHGTSIDRSKTAPERFERARLPLLPPSLSLSPIVTLHVAAFHNADNTARLRAVRHGVPRLRRLVTVRFRGMIGRRAKWADRSTACLKAISCAGPRMDLESPSLRRSLTSEISKTGIADRSGSPRRYQAETG